MHNPPGCSGVSVWGHERQRASRRLGAAGPVPARGRLVPGRGWVRVLLWWDGHGWTAPTLWPPPPQVPAPPPGRLASWLVSPAAAPLLVAVAAVTAAGWVT